MMEQTFDLTVGEDGVLTLPAELQAVLGIQAGDILTLVQTETGFVFLPKRLVVPEIAAHLSRLMAEEGITLADLLAGLDEEGDKLFKERYGHLLSA